MMALVTSVALLAFTPPSPLVGQSAMRSASPMMSESRRAFVGTLAAAVAAAPLAAMADGASSPAVRARARAIYGSRIARLVGASNEAIIEDKNTFALFKTGVYRADASSKDLRAKLSALEKAALKAAKAGDSAGAQAAVKEFVALGEIKGGLDTDEDSIFNPKQRRNPGAPATSEVVAQMGTQKYALYEAKPTGKVIGK